MSALFILCYVYNAIVFSPGDWYRNPEFGRAVEDPKKRGRRGSKGQTVGEKHMSPYPFGEIYQRSHKVLKRLKEPPTAAA